MTEQQENRIIEVLDAHKSAANIAATAITKTFSLLVSIYMYNYSQSQP